MTLLINCFLLSFLQAGFPSCRPANNVKALKANPKEYQIVLNPLHSAERRNVPKWSNETARSSGKLGSVRAEEYILLSSLYGVQETCVRVINDRRLSRDHLASAAVQFMMWLSSSTNAASCPLADPAHHVCTGLSLLFRTTGEARPRPKGPRAGVGFLGIGSQHLPLSTSYRGSGEQR